MHGIGISVGWIVTQKLHSLRHSLPMNFKYRIVTIIQTFSRGLHTKRYTLRWCYQNGEFLPNAMGTGFSYRSCTAMAPPVKACFEKKFQIFSNFSTEFSISDDFLISGNELRNFSIILIWICTLISIRTKKYPLEISISVFVQLGSTRSKWALSQQVILTW